MTILGEFKHLLLTCIKGCGLHNMMFKIRDAFICTVLTVDIPASEVILFSLSMC